MCAGRFCNDGFCRCGGRGGGNCGDGGDEEAILF